MSALGQAMAGVDGEALPDEQTLGHAAAQHRLEQFPQQIAVAEKAMVVLREDRLIDPPFAHHRCTAGLNDRSE